MTMTISGTDGLTFPDSTAQYSGSYFSFKNRIINGDMRIDQRNAGAAVTTTASFPVDRFIVVEGTAGVFSAQRTTTVPTGSGFINSLAYTVTTASGTITTTQYAAIQQRIEGFNVADLMWGTASAKSITLSFWVQASVTGTFAGCILNSAADRSYVFTYSISSANTWEQKTITIAGDTSGTWLTDNGIGMFVMLDLGTGPTYQTASVNSWLAGRYQTSTTAVQLMTTLNATFYITGVQLEVGSVATPFERRPYGTELALCQRYYFKIKAADGNQVFGNSYNSATTNARGITSFLVTMRIAPSALEQSGTAGDYRVLIPADNVVCSSVPTFLFATPYSAATDFPVASGLTSGQGSMLRAVNSSAYLAWSAEL